MLEICHESWICHLVHDKEIAKQSIGCSKPAWTYGAQAHRSEYSGSFDRDDLAATTDQIHFKMFERFSKVFSFFSGSSSCLGDVFHSSDSKLDFHWFHFLHSFTWPTTPKHIHWNLLHRRIGDCLCMLNCPGYIETIFVRLVACRLPTSRLGCQQIEEVWSERLLQSSNVFDHGKGGPDALVIFNYNKYVRLLWRLQAGLPKGAPKKGQNSKTYKTGVRCLGLSFKIRTIFAVFHCCKRVLMSRVTDGLYASRIISSCSQGYLRVFLHLFAMATPFPSDDCDNHGTDF